MSPSSITIGNDIINFADIENMLLRIKRNILLDDNIYNKFYELSKINSPSHNPYYYCDHGLLTKINSMIEKYKKNSDSEPECCICLDKFSMVDKVYFKCGHFICKNCDGNNNVVHCPLCRTYIERVLISDKYAIVCTGTPTNFHTFENGGFLSMAIIFIPDFENKKCEIFENIKYFDDNIPRLQFYERIYNLFANGYVIVLQNHKVIKNWMCDVMLKDLAHDKRFMYE